MSQTLSSLARLTLRQLRQIASDLGVPLYSRKSKETLVDDCAEHEAADPAESINSYFYSHRYYLLLVVVFV